GKNLFHFAHFVGRAVDVDLALKLVMGKQCFMQSAGAASFQVLTHQGEGGEHGKAFECEQDVDTGFVLHPLQKFKVLPQQSKIDDIGGSFNDVGGERGRG